MARKYNYELGDYVKYEGNLSTLSSILRDPDFGKIEEFEVHHGVERIYLYLLRKKQNIWCDFRDIRPIYTEPEHLKALNFKTIDIGGRKKYELDATTVSGAAIQTPKTVYLLQYCVGDFTKGIPNIDTYLKNEELDLEKIFAVYPDVSNVNDLLAFLKSQGRQINEEKIFGV